MWWFVATTILFLFLWIKSEFNNAPWYDENTNRFYRTYDQTTNTFKNLIKIMDTPTAVFKYPQDVVMYIPLSSIEKIDGSVLVLKEDAPDYTVIRDKIKEIAPAVQGINIATAILTFI